MVTMNNWFECKITYDKIGTEDGKQHKVTDTYLLDAVSFTEAEARIIEIVRPYMSGEFTVSNVKRSRIYEIFESDKGDYWFRDKVFFVVFDPEKGKEKRIPSTMLVQAESVKVAIASLEENMKATMSDWELWSITGTAILDVIPYQKPENNEAETIDGMEVFGIITSKPLKVK